MPTVRRPCPSCRVAWIVAPARRCRGCETARRRDRIGRGYDAAYQRVRKVVLARDGYTCRWCGGPANTADHLVPLSRGGASTEQTMVAACLRCNSKRGAREKP
jgi:5-methylcytosine-specific restriction endonuclease McrA